MTVAQALGSKAGSHSRGGLPFVRSAASTQCAALALNNAGSVRCLPVLPRLREWNDALMPVYDLTGPAPGSSADRGVMVPARDSRGARTQIAVLVRSHASA